MVENSRVRTTIALACYSSITSAGTVSGLEVAVPCILQGIQQQAMMTNQVAACNVAHEAEACLARWLLMVEDRTGADSLQLTQDFLAQMLGARRTTVAIAVGTLQRSDYIEYDRGKVHLLSRDELRTPPVSATL